MKRKIFEGNFSHELLTKTRQKTKLCNAFSNQLGKDIKLIKPQISKIIPLGLTVVASPDAGIYKKILEPGMIPIVSNIKK